MKIEAFSLCKEGEETWMGLRGARGERAWLPRYAYRCLPLKVANSAGIEIYLKRHVTMKWNGRDGLEDVEVRPPDNGWCVSHFGSGVISFSVPYLFRTPKGFALWVSGPANEPHDGISPLEGIVESSWSSYTFTMNWRLTAVDVWVTFVPDQAIARVVPVRLAMLGGLELVERKKAEIPPRKLEKYEAWWKGRNEFLKRLERHDPSVRELADHKGQYQKEAEYKGLKSARVATPP